MKAKMIIGWLLMLCFSAAQSQNLEKIIARHIEARGGAGKWEKIENIKITGRFVAFSEEKDFWTQKCSDGNLYSEFWMGKFKVIEAFDGKNGWTIDPWHDFSYPRLMNKAEVNALLQKSALATPFFQLKQEGIQAQLLENENVDGVECYVIKLIRSNGFEGTWYLRTDNYLEYKCKSQWVDFATQMSAESFYEDFRTINGLVIPYYEERSYGQRNNIQKISTIEFNVPFDRQKIKMPKSQEMQKLAFLEGHWDVKAETWVARRNKWYPLDKTTSQIAFIGNNMIQEQLILTEDYVQPIVQQFSFHHSTQKYRMTHYNDFNSETELFIGLFEGADLVVDQHVLPSSMETGQIERYVFTPVNDREFTVAIKISTDNGANWYDSRRLSYVRAESR
ncbi:MAG TPA: hypothetical protein DCX89_08620 [Saprospirales bacterium]|nr:hypothetical protein [Saprospirales bacterium]HRQ30872.1 hypothetical protein [Saprospiraceae bacterium]